jgi:hypothetical protein
MKTIVAAVAVAAVIASPAWAQTSQRRAQPQQNLSQFDQPVGRTESQPRSAAGNAVYENGQYLGADPDPNVRLNLHKDFEGRDF